jgi:hypothetical protein
LIRGVPMTATSIKLPFQSAYLMDISRGFERLEIAQSGQLQASPSEDSYLPTEDILFFLTLG